jgi:baculoviral IAP repeat-containing protein 7/8
MAKSSTPHRPDLSLLLLRLNTYENWPKEITQHPLKLSEAGFYYTGKEDRVRCFSCGGGLMDWTPTTDPWLQHAMWYSQCAYVRQKKDKNYIKNVRECRASYFTSLSDDDKLPEIMKIKNLSIVFENRLKEASLCRICCNNNYNIVFIPCGHVLSCQTCSERFNKCPFCRQIIKSTMTIYFP